MIGAFRSSYCSIVPASSCSLSGPLLYRSPVVVFLDRGYPCFRNFNSTIPVDVVRVKSYVNSFLDPTCVPVRISINKLDLIPDRIVAGLVGVFRNGGGLGTGESYIPVVFFDPLLHRSPCFPDVDFPDKAIHIRLHPNNINRDSGIEIPEAWIPTIKKHNNRRTVQQRTTEGTATRRNNGTIGLKCTNHSRPL